MRKTLFAVIIASAVALPGTASAQTNWCFGTTDLCFNVDESASSFNSDFSSGIYSYSFRLAGSWSGSALTVGNSYSWFGYVQRIEGGALLDRSGYNSFTHQAGGTQTFINISGLDYSGRNWGEFDYSDFYAFRVNSFRCSENDVAGWEACVRSDPPVGVPEPGTMALLASGALGLLGVAARRRRVS